jgi:cytochrome c biogenesis protein CcdA
MITFLEGIVSFISSCMLPLLPVLVSFRAISATGRETSYCNAVVNSPNNNPNASSFAILGIYSSFQKLMSNNNHVKKGLIPFLKHSSAPCVG